ncbi:MAG: hypothetical protein M3R17_03290 [Bacteroidota bacterium]|nr:hypothetical protein [Bacteroidota bacterium]
MIKGKLLILLIGLCSGTFCKADTITNWQLYSNDSLIYADNISNPQPEVPLVRITAKNSNNTFTFYNRHCTRSSGVEKQVVFINQNKQEVARMNLNDQDGFDPVHFHAYDVTQNNLVKQNDLIGVYYFENDADTNRLIGLLKFEIVPGPPGKWHWNMIIFIIAIFCLGVSLYFRFKRVFFE